MTDILTTIQPPLEITTTVQSIAPISTVLSVGQGPAGPQGATGPQGDQGDPGPQGPTGIDLHYVHDQMVPSATWTITHALGKTPSVVIIDSADSEVEGAVSYPNITTVVIEFSAAFSGKAYLN